MKCSKEWVQSHFNDSNNCQVFSNEREIDRQANKCFGENSIGQKYVLKLFEKFDAVQPLYLGFCKSFVFSMTEETIADENVPMK